MLLVVLNVGVSAFYKIRHGQQIVFLLVLSYDCSSDPETMPSMPAILESLLEEYHARNKAWYDVTRLHSRLAR